MFLHHDHVRPWPDTMTAGSTVLKALLFCSDNLWHPRAKISASDFSQFSESSASETLHKIY